MKKGKITMGLAVLALTGAFVLPVYAQSEGGQSQAKTEIKASVQSVYRLTIPAKTEIPFEAVSTDLSGTLKVAGNVRPTQKVQVTARPEAFKNTEKNKILPYKLMNGQEEFRTAVWDEAQLRAGLGGKGKEIRLSIAIDKKDWTSAEAGDYEGSIIFTSELKDE